MPSLERTGLWTRTLAPRADDPHRKERDLLRTTFEKFRDRVKPIAETIARDLPDFTIHDVSHLDALWEYADLICGPAYEINPCEAFVLGGAFLLHDLGMGLAAYPDGFAAQRQSLRWKDAIRRIQRDKAEREGVRESDVPISPKDEMRATAEVLREVHAERAATLGLESWVDPQTHERLYLIENIELRHSFGPIIGRIAHSHWWPVESLAIEFPTPMGADTSFPFDWTVDTLKVACLLRLADFAHLDDRRAPLFRRLLQKPSPESDVHWQFQVKLYQPRLDSDRLVYTAKSGFSPLQSSSWWLCFDTLTGLDEELRRVDALLADSDRARFAARGVSQIDNPARLSKLIPTTGWSPVDTRIRVSAVASLVAKLGGEQLYGDTLLPPLRELLQNAADAIHARRLADNEASTWGEINVRTGVDASGRWIEVEDCGIGMSAEVLTGPFLDFGTSFWRTHLFHKELPGLEAAGFQPIGKFGIGFYSVFMWGNRVVITTQKFDQARAATLVLEFKEGLAQRPLLRAARAEEYLRKGGTKVRVWLRDEGLYGQLLTRKHYERSEAITLDQVCSSIYPAADIDVVVDALGSERVFAVRANDWLTIGDEQLYNRLTHIAPYYSAPKPFADVDATKLIPMIDTSGRCYGRAGVSPLFSQETCIVTIGGLRAGTIQGLVGIFSGETQTAARDVGTPNVPNDLLKNWAIRTWEEAKATYSERWKLARVRDTAVQCGAEIEDGPVVRGHEEWLTASELVDLARSSETIICVQDWRISSQEQVSDTVPLTLLKNVLLLDLSTHIVVRGLRQTARWPKSGDFDDLQQVHEISELIAKAWGCSVDFIKGQLPNEPWTDDGSPVEIGTFGGKPLVVPGIVLQRNRFQ